MNRSVLVATHLLAVGIGWLAFQAAGSGSGAAAGETGAAAATRTPRPDELAEGRRILAEMRKGWRKAEEGRVMAPPQKELSLSERRQLRLDYEAEKAKKLLDLAAGLSLTADPGAELRRLMREDSEKGSAFIIVWLRADPAAAMKFLSGEQDLGNGLEDPIRLWSRESSPQAILDLMESAPAWGQLLAGLALQRAVATDFSVLGELADSLEGSVDRMRLFEMAFENIPPDRHAAALDWIFSNLKGREAVRAVQTAAFMMQHRQEDALGAKAFLKEAMGRLDAEGREVMDGWGNVREILSAGVGPDSPMDERVEVALMSENRGKTPEENRANARASIVSQDLSNWLDAGRWNEALHAGAVSPAELWAQAQAAFPQFNREADKAGMLKAVFLRSALADPQAAIGLLEAQGREDQLGSYGWQTTVYGANNQFEAAMALANALPEEWMKANLSNVQGQYRQMVEREAEARGSSWIDWVKQQPAGLNRDLLYHYTACYLFKQGREEEGAAFTSKVRDPAVRALPKP